MHMPAPAYTRSQTPKGTVQKQLLLASRQWTAMACGKLLAFIFWVLGLGRLKLWSKKSIYAIVFMGSCTTESSELRAERGQLS